MKLRTRLIAAFMAATLVPVALTWWTSLSLLERSLELAPGRELDDLSKSLEKTAQRLYQRTKTALQEDAQAGRIRPAQFELAGRTGWPVDIEDFYSASQAESFSLADNGTDITYLKRAPGDGGVLKFVAPIGGDVNLKQIREQYSQARARLGQTRDRNIHRGFTYAFAVIASVIWLGALSALIWWADRLSRPIQRLTDALHQVAAGDLSTRVTATDRDDEIGVAMQAFNEMAERVERSREKLVYVTRLASWQALAKKMAHEVKNSLTPIRLTMEEIASRYASRNDNFIDQASQIVAEEVTALEKRVRAFMELASEPPVILANIDLNSLIEERIAFLRAGHPEVRYETHLATPTLPAHADSDLVRGVLTNLLENAAQAAGIGGVVRASTTRQNGHVVAEIHDSGSGLTPLARSALFEPTISFKKGGMGLGLSIARRSALLCGGDLSLVEGQLGGAAFRLTLPVATAAEAGLESKTTSS